MKDAFPFADLALSRRLNGVNQNLTRFLGRLYAEAEMLALARAYQERAGFHLKHPRLS